MSKHPQIILNFFSAAIWILFITIPALIFSSNITFPTVDAAHHYALISLLATNYTRTGTEDYLGEMAYYPPLAHYLAAILAQAMSPYRAMHILAFLSISISYACILKLVLDSSFRAAVFATVAFSALLVAPSAFLTVGSEIRGNFFFSQLIGYAALFGTICFALNRLSTMKSILILPLFGGFGAIIAAIHALPALHLLGAGGVLLALRIIKKPNATDFISIVIYAAILFMLVKFHPSLVAMRAISEHQGALNFGFVVENAGRMLISGTLITTAILLYFCKNIRNGEVALCIVSISTSATTFAQWWLFVNIGEGSMYGVDKSLFVQATLVVANTACLLFRDDIEKSQLQPLLPPFASFFIAYAAIAHSTQYDIAPVLVIESKADDLLKERGQTAVAVQSLSPSLNYAFSLGIFHILRDRRAAAILSENRIIEGIDLVVTDKNGPYDLPECRLRELGDGLVLVEGDCLISKSTTDNT